MLEPQARGFRPGSCGAALALIAGCPPWSRAPLALACPMVYGRSAIGDGMQLAVAVVVTVIS
jgi:hypothetical protein